MTQGPISSGDVDKPADPVAAIGSPAQRLCTAVLGALDRERLEGGTFGPHVLEADALAAVIDEAKQEGLVDPALTTKSIVLFCQSLHLGAQFLERNHGGGVATWSALIERILEALGPQQQKQGLPPEAGRVHTPP